MGDPLGITASITAVLQVSATIVKYLKEIRDGAADRERLHREIVSARGTLLSLKDHVELSDPDEPWMSAVEGLNKPEGPLELYRLALEQLTEKLGLAQGKKTRLNSIKTIGRALQWPLKSDEVKEILALLERQKSLFVLALQMDHMALSRALKSDGKETQALVRVLTVDVADVRKDVKTILRRNRDEAEAKVLEWLSALQPQRKHLDVAAQRLKGTGDWFLELPAFKAWKDTSTDQKFFCCRGIPGAGKSCIASLVIDHLSEDASIADAAVGYLYCDYRDQGKDSGQTPRQMFGSLVKQLSNTRSDLPKTLVDLYNKEKVSGEIAVAKDFIKAIISLCDERATYLVIDALDESDPKEHRPALLQFLAALESSKARVLVTTRPDQKDVEKYIRKFQQTTIEASDADIRTMLTMKIRQRIDEDEDMEELIVADLQEEIVSSLVAKAHGMFLLPALQVQTVLEKLTPSAIREAIANLPKGLYEEFERTISRIKRQSEERQSLAMATLMWISHGHGGLTITALRHAFAVSLGDTDLDTQKLTPLRIFGSSITDSCQGLVTIDEEGSVVRLVHYSLQEFFDDRDAELFPEAQEVLTEVCLTYCLFDRFDDGPKPDDESLEAFESRFPLYGYAASQWAYHCHSMEHEYESPVITELYQKLISNPKKFQKMTQGVWTHATRGRHGPGYSQEYSHGYTPLHHAVCYGLVALTKNLCEGGVDINSTIQRGHHKFWNVLHYIADTYIRDPGAASFVYYFSDRNIAMNDTPEGMVTPLQIALDKCRIETATALLRAGADPSAPGENGDTPLLTASRNGSVELVQLLLDYGADPSRTNTEGKTCLGAAIMSRSEETVECLLKAGGANQSSSVSNGFSHLMLAATVLNERMVKMLLDAKADPNAQNSDNYWTPLMSAIKEVSIMQLLVEHGANVNARTKKNDAALVFAAKNGLNDAVQFLLDHGAELNGRYEELDTVLMVAASFRQAETVRLLLRQPGIEVNAKNEPGNSALHLSPDDASVARLLIEEGKADIEARNNEGKTPIYAAARSISTESVAVLRVLLQAGARVDVRDDLMTTPLHTAVMANQYSKSEILTEAGVDVNARFGNDFAAHDYAGNVNLMRLLVNNGADIMRKNGADETVTHAAARKEDSEPLKFVLERGAPVDLVNYQNYTPLHLAADRGGADAVKLLLSRGASVQKRGQYDDTALHLAAKSGNVETVQLLLDANSDINALTDIGFTPIAMAAESGNTPVVRLLLDRGSQIHQIGISAEGAKIDGLFLAACNGREEAVRLLISYRPHDIAGPDPMMVCASATAARINGYESIATFLLEHGAEIWTKEELLRFMGRFEKPEEVKAENGDPEEVDQQELEDLSADVESKLAISDERTSDL